VETDQQYRERTSRRQEFVPADEFWRDLKVPRGLKEHEEQLALRRVQSANPRPTTDAG
jgi:hypothetical protein